MVAAEFVACASCLRPGSSSLSPDIRSVRHAELSRRASSDYTTTTYRLKGRGAVVAALALGASLGSIAAGGNIRVVGLLAVGHDDDERRCVLEAGCGGRGDNKRSGCSGGDGRVVVWRMEGAVEELGEPACVSSWSEHRLSGG